jgi:hypothetical protein
MGIFYAKVGDAATGTGTARTSINSSFNVPSKAREWVGDWSFVTAEAPAPAESIIGVWDLTGTDFNHRPMEHPSQVGGAHLGNINGIATDAMAYWSKHIPLVGTESIDVGYEPCDAQAGNGQAGMIVAFDTVRSGRNTIYGLSTREKATGTAAGQVTADNLDVKNALQNVEVFAAVTGAAVTADEQTVGSIEMRSTAWDPIQSINFFMEPGHAIEATSGQSVTHGPIRLPYDAVYTSRSATVEATYNLETALTAAGQFIHGIRYIGSKTV